MSLNDVRSQTRWVSSLSSRTFHQQARLSCQYRGSRRTTPADPRPARIAHLHRRVSVTYGQPRLSGSHRADRLTCLTSPWRRTTRSRRDPASLLSALAPSSASPACFRALNSGEAVERRRWSKPCRSLKPLKPKDCEKRTKLGAWMPLCYAIALIAKTASASGSG